MAYVTSDMIHTSGDGTLGMRARTGPADWAPPPKIAGGKRASPAGRAGRPEFSTRPDVFVRTNRM